MLEIKNLSVHYGPPTAVHPALKDISLQVAPGEILALIGPNGAGKTTLIKTISGVLRPSAGVLLWQGQDLAHLSERQRASRLAVVPQARNLPEGFTVWQTVMLGRTPYLGWLGKMTPQDHIRIQWALEQTDTLSLANRLIQELSGGEQQRVLLARALAQDSTTLLLDEPTAHLDLRHQSGLLNLVRRLAKEQGLAVLMALHDLNLVAIYADRLALLVAGEIRSMGSPSEVLNPEYLMEAYQVPLKVISHPDHGTPLVLPDGHR